MQKRARREAGPFGEKLDGVIDSKGRNTFNRAFGYRSSRVHFYITSGVLQLSTGSSRVAFGHGVRTVEGYAGNDSNLLIVFYVQIVPDDFVMQLHRF